MNDMQIRRNGISIDNPTARKKHFIQGQILKLEKNPFTKYVEMQGIENDHICYEIFPYKYSLIKKLVAQGWRIVEVFERGK